jgi:hypothetical protein
MGNIYNKMTREELDNEYNSLIEYIILLSNQSDEYWKYHPSNPKFQNPIKLYKEIQEIIENQKFRLKQIEDIFNGLEKTN